MRIRLFFNPHNNEERKLEVKMKWYNVKFLDCFDFAQVDTFYCVNEEHVRTEFHYRYPCYQIIYIEEVE